MKHETAELLTDYKGEIREDYNGSIYAPTTTAVFFDSEEDFYHALALSFNDCLQDNNYENGDLLVKLLKNINFDNMGKGIVVY